MSSNISSGWALIKASQDKEEFTDDFITLLSDMYKLTEHHFIAKNQNQYLKSLKASLKPNECIIILDCADNFLFAVQDTAQAFHWKNAQGTIHPFVVYHKSCAIGLLHVSVTMWLTTQ